MDFGIPGLWDVSPRRCVFQVIPNVIKLSMKITHVSDFAGASRVVELRREQPRCM